MLNNRKAKLVAVCAIIVALLTVAVLFVFIDRTPITNEMADKISLQLFLADVNTGGEIAFVDAADWFDEGALRQYLQQFPDIKINSNESLITYKERIGAEVADLKNLRESGELIFLTEIEPTVMEVKSFMDSKALRTITQIHWKEKVTDAFFTVTVIDWNKQGKIIGYSNSHFQTRY